MARFSTSFLKFLLRLLTEAFSSEGLPAQIGKDELSRSSSLLSKSSSLIDAGDVLYFNYANQERAVFVVAARGGTGVYNTPKSNKVISGFLINDATPELIVSVISGLYKNAEKYGLPIRMLFTYKVVKAFGRMFHESNFRTFMTNRIVGNINQLNLVIPKNASKVGGE